MTEPQTRAGAGASAGDVPRAGDVPQVSDVPQITDVPRAGSRRRVAVLVGPLLAALLVLALAMWHPWHVSKAGGSVDLGAAPSYALTNQRDEPVASTAFAGRVQVVSFLFPFCTTYCPFTTHKLATLQAKLSQAGLADRVQFVAFNLGPADSTTADMAAYLKQYGVDPADQRWSFLTGTQTAVDSVVRDGYGVAYVKRPAAAEPDGPDGANKVPISKNALAEAKHVDYDIVHNEVINLVAPDGHIRGTFDGIADLTDDELYDAVSRLIAAS